MVYFQLIQATMPLGPVQTKTHTKVIHQPEVIHQPDLMCMTSGSNSNLQKEIVEKVDIVTTPNVTLALRGQLMKNLPLF